MNKRRRIKANMVWTTSFKQRETDKRYKDGVDKGRFSNNTIPLPLKSRTELLPAQPVVEMSPKQVIRQEQASRHLQTKNKNKNMKRRHYSRKETKQLRVLIDENNSSTKPLSLRQLSFVAAKELSRAEFGIYNKMLKMCVQKPKYQKTARKQAMIAQPKQAPVQASLFNQQPAKQQSVTFGKPTKIEISDAGMTFYF